MAGLNAFTKSNLNKQGFGKFDDDAKSRLVLPLRFTPAVAITLIAIGLVLQSPIWLGAMALVALSGVLFPQGMLIDLVYNLVVRHLFGAPTLPPTPTPRRFSYLLSAIFLTGAALAFYYGLALLGFFLGILVVLAGTVLTTTLWCLGSWWYRLIFGQAVTN
jgi:energy-converting hydrogenase Eha subunit A